MTGGPTDQTIQRSPACAGPEEDVDAAPPHPIRDPTLHGTFDRLGYVTVPLLGASEILCLRRTYADIVGAPPPGFSSVMLLEDSDFRRRCHAAVLAVLEPLCRAMLRGYTPYLASFVTKSGPDSEMLPHQDWPLVDERIGAPTLRLWCPLQDVDEHTGALFVSPGSHRLPFLLRAENLAPAVRLDSVTDEPMRCLRLRGGEAVIHDGRLVHGSPAVAAGATRLAVSVALIAEGVEVTHLRQADDGGSIERYRVPIDFFFEHRMGTAVPDAFEPVEHLRDDNPIIGPAELAALIPRD